jgi:hypothetical protein
VSGAVSQYDVAMSSQPGAATRPSIRSIALPTEHGGWGFTLEPILLGLLVAPSAAAWELSVAALAVFLARRPFKLVSTDVVRRRWLPRTTTAAVFTGLYGGIAVAGIAGAVVTAEAPFWAPFLVALPLAGLALYGDAHSRSRTLLAEIAGSAAMGSTVAAITLAAGWDARPAFGMWIVLVARGIGTIALVRGQIRRVHGKPTLPARIYSAQALAIAVVLAAAVAGWVPWLAYVAIIGIALLAYVSLRRPPVPAQVVGWTQIAVGLAVVLSTAIGVWMEW